MRLLLILAVAAVVSLPDASAQTSLQEFVDREGRHLGRGLDAVPRWLRSRETPTQVVRVRWSRSFQVSYTLTAATYASGPVYQVSSVTGADGLPPGACLCDPEAPGSDVEVAASGAVIERAGPAVPGALADLADAVAVVPNDDGIAPDGSVVSVTLDGNSWTVETWTPEDGYAEWIDSASGETPEWSHARGRIADVAGLAILAAWVESGAAASRSLPLRLREDIETMLWWKTQTQAGRDPSPGGLLGNGAAAEALAAARERLRATLGRMGRPPTLSEVDFEFLDALIAVRDSAAAQPGVVRRFLALGASPVAWRLDGATQGAPPLLLVRHPEAAEMLVAAGADPSDGSWGTTPLLRALRLKPASPELVRTLIRLGADPDAERALDHASADLIGTLLDAGADPSQTSLLHDIARRLRHQTDAEWARDWEHTTRLLLDAGVDPEARDAGGESVAEIEARMRALRDADEALWQERERVCTVREVACKNG